MTSAMAMKPRPPVIFVQFMAPHASDARRDPVSNPPEQGLVSINRLAERRRFGIFQQPRRQPHRWKSSHQMRIAGITVDRGELNKRNSADSFDKNVSAKQGAHDAFANMQIPCEHPTEDITAKPLASWFALR
jgi:hypothetical protein